MATGLLERAKIEGWTDEEVVERVKGGETALYEILMRRYNQRLYRAARAILKDEAEAEDVMQDAYVRAFQNLHQFEGRAVQNLVATNRCERSVRAVASAA